MSGLHVLGDDDTVLAFALAGVGGQAVGTPAEAQRALAAFAGAPRSGERADGPPLPRLLVVTSRVADMVRERLHAVVAEGGVLVLEIPGCGDDTDADPVGDLVARIAGGRP